MGYNKKLYNVLGGVTSSIIANPIYLVYPKNSQILQFVVLFFVNIIQYCF